MILPEDFIRQTKRIMGEEMWRKLTLGLAQEPPVSIRMNPRKCGSGGCEPADADGMVAWCEDGYYLSTRPAITCPNVFRSRSTRCFTPDCITFRKPRRCLSTAFCASI